ncbi:MAG TPA: sulfatase-like hydrolase/transferase [Mycobacteriales bacterium]|nr:sulfatase-like hydrolase/transferase [Mycobacteriales bacterium]
MKTSSVTATTSVVALALLAPLSLSSATPGAESVRDLGTLGGTTSRAVAVDGDVAVGWSEVLPGSTLHHAFAIDLADPDAPMRDLTPTNLGSSEATAVDGSTVVGWMQTPGGARHAFAYDLAAAVPTPTDLGSLGGDSTALGVDGSTVVGWSQAEPGGPHHAFATDLGATDPTPLDLGDGDAVDVNGDLVAVDEKTTGYLYRLSGPSAGRLDVIVPSDTSEMGAAPGAVNGGVAVGAAWDAAAGTPTAFAYDADAVTPAVRIPVLGPSPSTATDVSGDLVVGWTGTGTARRARALDLSTTDPALDLGAWTPVAVDGTIAVGNGTVGTSYAVNLGHPSPSAKQLPPLSSEGGTVATDVSGDRVVGSAKMSSGNRHATAWTVFQGATLTVGLDRTGITYGGSATLTGQLTVAADRPLSGREVDVYYRANGATAWLRGARLTTGASGRVRIDVSPHRNIDYQLRFAGDATAEPVASATQSLAVHPRVTGSLTDATVRPGVDVDLVGKVRPTRTVTLQRYDDSGWHDVRSKSPTAKGTYAFDVPTERAGAAWFRTLVKGSRYYTTAASKLRNLYVRKPVPVSAVRDLPNVVVILTDDQKVDTLAHMAKVQRLLVDKGVRYSRASVTIPSCCPSRVAILTGKFARHTGVYQNGGVHGGWGTFHRLGEERRTIALALQRRGYRTAMFGKYLNFYGQLAPFGYRPPGWDRFIVGLTPNGGGYYDYKLSNGQVLGHDAADYSADVQSDQSVQFIRSTPAGRPLFLMLTPSAPHVPFVPAPRYAGHWEGRLGPFHPASLDDDMSGKPLWMQSLVKPSQEEIDSVRAVQQDMLMSVDDQVQAVVAALRDTGRLHHTLILFTSDHGFMWGEHRWMAKDVPYTPSDAVPFVIRWDGHTARGTVDDRLALNVDIAATIARVTGTSFSSDGANVLGSWRRPGFVLEQMGTASIGRPAYCGWRGARYWFVQYDDGEQELYDVQRDPDELHNLADDPAYASLKASLLAKTRDGCVPTPPDFSW